MAHYSEFQIGNSVKKMTTSLGCRSSLIGLALGIRLTCCALNSFAQTTNLQMAVENAETTQDQKIQQLQEKLEQIQKELIALKLVNSAHPETHGATPTKALGPSPALSEAADPEITAPSNPKSEPFAFADFTWLTG